MCVIIANDSGKIPDKDTLVACARSNSDGIGLAWLTDNGVSFRKGIKLKHLAKLLVQIEAKKLPYVIHFRAATSCGVENRLCHPFPVTTDWDKLGKLRGEGLNAVVAHNGTWRSWQKHFKEEEVNWLEDKKWSDSAIIAWLVAAGRDIALPVSGYGNRLAFLSVKRGIQLWGDGWKEEEGISYSNTYWRYAMKGVSTLQTNYQTTYYPKRREPKEIESPWEDYDINDDWLAAAAEAGWGIGEPISGQSKGGRVLSKEGAKRYVAQDGTSYCYGHEMFDRCWTKGGYTKEQAAADKATGGVCEIGTRSDKDHSTRNFILADEELVGNKIMKRANGYFIDTGDRCYVDNPIRAVVTDATPIESGNAEDRDATKGAK